MQTTQKSTLIQIFRVLKNTALIASISFGMWHQPDAALAQTPLSEAPLDFAIRSQPRFCRSHLETAIASITNNPKYRSAQWGILIKPLEIPTILYQQNADVSLIPASNVKLLTTAAALKIASAQNPASLSSFQDWVTEVNRFSDNAKADALRRRIGGQAAISNALDLLGVSADSYSQVDGSGLSRNNRVTPSALVTILQSMFTDDPNGLFYESLSVAGVNGTLRNRFRNTSVQGNLHGKTGTLRGVRALSGYLDNPHYGTIAFSIVVNQSGVSGDSLAPAIDQIVLQTAQVDRCD